MAIDFPNSPATNATHTVGDKTWIYADGKWSTSTGVSTTNASLLVSGTLDNARLPASATTITTVGTLGSLAVTNGVTAATFTGALIGNASTATNVAYTGLTGTVPTWNQNTTGNAATVTTNANLTGGVTSVGNAATVVTNANLTGDVTSVGNATTLTNAPVIAKVLTGYVSGSGTVAATDSILQAVQKLNGNVALKANLASPTFTGTVTAPTFSGALTGNVTGNVTGSSGSVVAYAARVSGWTGTGTDYDLYVGTTWEYGNTNLQFNSTTRIELNNNGTSVIGTLGVSGLTTGTYFKATDSTGHFYSTGTFTDIGNSSGRVRNSTSIRTEIVTGLAVYVSSTGTIGVLSSSRRFKENIVDYDDQESRLLTVNPVTFDYKDGVLDAEENRFNHFGLIAEDVHDAGLTHLVSYDDGGPRGVNYTMLSVELLGIVKKQQTAIDDLLARVQALETI